MLGKSIDMNANLETILNEFYTKWVEALRGPYYTQMDGSLCDIYNQDRKFSHCAVGVALNECIGISNEEMVGAQTIASLDKKTKDKIPKQLLHYLTFSDFIDEIMKYNDEEGWSFNSIADEIERIKL